MNLIKVYTDASVNQKQQIGAVAFCFEYRKQRILKGFQKNQLNSNSLEQKIADLTAQQTAELSKENYREAQIQSTDVQKSLKQRLEERPDLDNVYSQLVAIGGIMVEKHLFILETEKK